MNEIKYGKWPAVRLMARKDKPEYGWQNEHDDWTAEVQPVITYKPYSSKEMWSVCIRVHIDRSMPSGIPTAYVAVNFPAGYYEWTQDVESKTKTAKAIDRYVAALPVKPDTMVDWVETIAAFWCGKNRRWAEYNSESSQYEIGMDSKDWDAIREADAALLQARAEREAHEKREKERYEAENELSEAA